MITFETAYIPLRLKVAMIIAIVIFFIVVLHLLKQQKLQLRYTLLWLACGVFLLILVLFPNVISFLGSLIGIQTTMNALYIFLIALLIILCISLTSIVSVQKSEIQRLAQNAALLERRIRNLEEAQKKDTKEESDQNSQQQGEQCRTSH